MEKTQIIRMAKEIIALDVKRMNCWSSSCKPQVRMHMLFLEPYKMICIKSPHKHPIHIH